MPPTPFTLGLVVFLVFISMVAASTIGAVGRGKALATVVVVAVLAIPVGYLGTLMAPAEHASAAEHGVGAGNALNGEALFKSGACPACHTISGISSGAVGPDLTQAATVAATRKPGTSAEAYLRESISNPQAVVTPGFPSPSAMPAGLATGATLDDLVAFLMTKS